MESAVDTAGEAAEGDEGHDELDGDGDQGPGEAGEQAGPPRASGGLGSRIIAPWQVK